MSIELEISKHLPDTCNKWFESRIQNKKAGMTTRHSCFFGKDFNYGYNLR